MAYIKNTWVDQDVERPKTYEVTNNQDGSITLTDSFGLVTELGTPVNETNMNHIEDGIDGCAIRKHNLTETFNLGEWVLGGSGDAEGLYRSLVSNNVGNAISDTTKWEKISMGASRNIGEIVQSTIPLADAGLHLLDGTLIDGTGLYAEFVTYIAGLVSQYPNLFETEANWQQSVTNKGVCGKFVYNSTNNTVRLPKITGFIEGTTDASALGDLINAGLPNITGTITTGTISTTGAFAGTSLVNSRVDYNTSNVNDLMNTSFNASRSSSIYGNSSTVQPQAIKVFYYIVLTTSTKTDIQVDIDEIATDLNGKADVDFTNVTDTGKILIAHSAMPSTSYTNMTLGASGTSYTMPADGWLLITLALNINGFLAVGGIYTQSGTANGGYASVFKPVRKGESVSINYENRASTVRFQFIYAVGSESEAS